jgi:hypothetical protein
MNVEKIVILKAGNLFRENRAKNKLPLLKINFSSNPIVFLLIK